MRPARTRGRLWPGRIVLGLAALLAAGVVAVPGRPAGADDDYAKVKARYEAYVRRPSLLMRTRGRVQLARTGDLRALRVLAGDYAKPEEPREVVAYLVATLGAVTFEQVPGAPQEFEAWRGRERKPRDAWLWHQTLAADVRAGGGAALVVARDSKVPALQRAAATRAAADERAAGGLEAAPEILARNTETGALKGVLPEAVSALILAHKDRRGTPEFRGAVEPLIRLLDDKLLPERAKRVISRHLAAAFDTPNAGTSAAPWLRELEASEAAAGEGERPPEQTQYADFFGLRSQGKRIVFVIDASDSMLARLTADERARLQRPTTPSGAPGAKARPGEEIDWDAIVTRYDAARAVLQHSIRTLPPNVHFGVVLFGDEAVPLEATKRLVPNTPKHVSAAIAALNAIEPLPPDGKPERPFGRLRGATNLHGGMRRAFELTTEGLLESGEYVDAKALDNGCDAVFLLSDGAPTFDDYAGWDDREANDHAADPESGKAQTATPQLHYWGPYATLVQVEGFDFLTPELRRLNLIRNAEIHCISIGEANDALLARIAAYGLGQVERIGAAPAK